MKRQKKSKKRPFILNAKKSNIVYLHIFIACSLFAIFMFWPSKLIIDHINSEMNQFLYYFLACLGLSISPVSAYGLFKFIKLIYDKILWKLCLDNPNYNGVWCGYLKGDGEKNSRKMAAMIVIEHSFNKISVHAMFKNNTNDTTFSSESYGYNFLSSIDNDEEHLSFEYRNVKWNSNAPDQKFEGFNTLIFSRETLNINYLAGRAEPTKGKIILKRATTKTSDFDRLWPKCSEQFLK